MAYDGVIVRGCIATARTKGLCMRVIGWKKYVKGKDYSPLKTAGVLIL